MPFPRPTLSSLIALARQDITSGISGIGQLLPVSKLGAIATTLAGFAHLQHDHIDWAARMAIPYTAEDEFLESWAGLKSVSRYPAVAAVGTATFQGATDLVIPANQIIRRADNISYITLAEVRFTSITATVQLAALEAGPSGNCPAGTPLTLATIIPGVTSTGLAAVAFTGGVEAEEDESLRARMLQKYGAPPQGGAADDYVTWALEVPGVTRAWCSPIDPTPGSVTVYAMLDEVNATSSPATSGFPLGVGGGATGEWRITPATLDCLAIANRIYPVRPVTAVVWVKPPTPQTINIQVANMSQNTSLIQSQIQAAVDEAFRQVGTPLGGTVFQSTISSAIDTVPGLGRWTLVSPNAPVTIAAGKLPVANITYS